MNITADLAPPDSIAIVGISGRWPGASNPDELWANLCAGVESIRPFTESELVAAGFDPAVLQAPSFVNAGAPIDDAEMFDAAFFGITPREAQALDPQRRVFLECTWHALEDAGYVPENVDGPIGIYAGSSFSSYLNRVQANTELVAAVGGYQTIIGNDKDHLTTYTAYKLSLTGPAITIQTACSTSLVAVVMACQSLINHECDLALAGGVSIRTPQHFGYFYEEGGVLSPDGHCRPFDVAGRGTVTGSGVGVVVLKRLTEALRDRDHIRAVILASAINNDGSLKVGYTAPSVEGQAEVITTALTLAGISPESVGYIEAHGTATPLGDPIEITAITQAFSETERRNFCAIGSVKSNIGHLDAAAGVTGLIKAALCVERKMLPPSLHFEKANPAIDFANSPLYVQDRLSEWPAEDHPRRAGVSSFGIGGTNAHVILEEAPDAEDSHHSRSAQLLVLSARSELALEKLASGVADNLAGLSLPDAAFTLAVGRRNFSHRNFLVCRDTEEAIKGLRNLPQRMLAASEHRGVVFLFPGQGSQAVGMGQDLYIEEPTFREEVDRCAALLEPHLRFDIREVLYSHGATDNELKQTRLAQPALFTVEYALARLLISWGIVPAAMMGHSLGEYVAACLAGVFALPDALALVADRGRLMQETAAGAMVATSLAEQEVRSWLPRGVAAAAMNGPTQTVFSGPDSAIVDFEEILQARRAPFERLRTSHAFHSETMDPILDQFRRTLESVALHPPSLPYVSNLTGTWQTDAAANPDYWVDHLRHAVRFGDGCRELCREYRTFIEVGPGGTLSRFLQPYLREAGDGVAIPTKLEQKSLLEAVGKLWTLGFPVQWSDYYAYEKRRRVSLSGYPFEWQHYDARPAVEAQQPLLGKNPDMESWFYLPSWRQTPRPQSLPNGGRWLVFLDAAGLGLAVVRELHGANIDVTTVELGEQFEKMDDGCFRIRPEEPDDYFALINALADAGTLPQKILHFWNVNVAAGGAGIGFYPLLHLAKALAQRSEPISVAVISSGVHAVLGSEEIYPERATLLGLCRVAPHEHPNQRWCNIDIEWPSPTTVGQITAECANDFIDTVIAYRNRRRWVETVEPVALPMNGPNSLLRSKGTYLITGGLGGIGLVLAEHLAKEYQARLVLVGRSALAADSPKWEKIAAMREAGAEVLMCAADVADVEQMRNVLAVVQERFDGLNGVIHSAGVAGGGMIQVKERAVAEAVLAPKVKGALTLASLLHDTKLDFFVTFSSLASLLGGFGQVDYCAANSFLDAFAHREAARGDRVTLTINWDSWNEVGMAINTELPPELEAYRAEALKNALRPAEGVASFERVLNSGLTQVCVSTTFLPWRLEQARGLTQPWATSEPAAATATTLHPRPALKNQFLSASTKTEEIVTKIWQDLLGLEQIGITDNFFELGGHSLLATQIVSRVHAQLKVKISVGQIFEAPTIQQLSWLLDEMQIESEDLARIITMVEGMSDEQVRLQLEQNK